MNKSKVPGNAGDLVGQDCVLVRKGHGAENVRVSEVGPDYALCIFESGAHLLVPWEEVVRLAPGRVGRPEHAGPPEHAQKGKSEDAKGKGED